MSNQRVSKLWAIRSKIDTWQPNLISIQGMNIKCHCLLYSSKNTSIQYVMPNIKRSMNTTIPTLIMTMRIWIYHRNSNLLNRIPPLWLFKRWTEMSQMRIKSIPILSKTILPIIMIMIKKRTRIQIWLFVKSRFFLWCKNLSAKQLLYQIIS